MPNGHLVGIVGDFYSEKLKEHKEDLIELENILTNDIQVYTEIVANGIGFDGRLKLSKLLLRQTIKRFFYDICRFQHFHGFYDRNKKMDECKKSATLAHWLLKFRPVQIIEHGTGARNQIFATLINQYFAFDWSVNAANIKAKEQELIPSFINVKERMVYNFTHRNFNRSLYVHFLEGLTEQKDSRKEISRLNKEISELKDKKV